MALAQVSLDDRYALERGRVLMTGIQALVRLPMLQRQRDLAAGLNTAGFISGYRGSPLGGLDQALWRARKFLEKSGIVFQPGINEDLAATAVWGSQQVGLFPGAKHDGVFALWYGKGPGVDRSLDVLKHGNHAGSSKHGGVLVVAGDDHAAKSSTLPHQSDHVFAAAVIPVLNPSGVQDYLDLGIHGWAMSRYSGCWVAFKAVTDTVESTAVVDVDPYRVETLIPGDFVMPPGGLSIRWPDPPLVQEARMQEQKAYAALAYARANRLNRIVIDSPRPRLGIITAGKSYLDVRQALDDLGIDEHLAAEIGLRVMKVGMTWPLEPDGTRHFAEGLEEILVVEEKRQHLEYQLKEELYNWSEAVRPRVIGKFDEKGEWSLPQGGWLLHAASELTPAMIAGAIAGRIARFHTSPKIEQRLRFITDKEAALARQRLVDPASAALLLGLPAQHQHARARGQPGAGRHRLPLHGDLDLSLGHPDLQPDGRRGCGLDRSGAVHRDAACLRQSRRRHLLPFRHPGDPGRGRGRRQHHLQDPLQRRRRHDRRPAARGIAQRRPAGGPARGRGAGADRGRGR